MHPKYVGDRILSHEVSLGKNEGQKCGKHKLKRENMALKTAYLSYIKWLSSCILALVSNLTD